jgi:hypothetical protein
MPWADASDAAGIRLDRPESRQIANSRRQISFGRRWKIKEEVKAEGEEEEEVEEPTKARDDGRTCRKT